MLSFSTFKFCVLLRFVSLLIATSLGNFIPSQAVEEERSLEKNFLDALIKTNNNILISANDYEDIADKMRDKNTLSLRSTVNGLPVKTIPDNIGLLTNLTSLELDGNQITALPEKITTLVNLKHLNLNQNRFKSLPTVLSQFTQLERLSVNMNELNEIPDFITSLHNLTTVEFARNPLLKKIPQGILELPSLHMLRLDHTIFGEIIDELEYTPDMPFKKQRLKKYFACRKHHIYIREAFSSENIPLSQPLDIQNHIVRFWIDIAAKEIKDVQESNLTDPHV